MLYSGVTQTYIEIILDIHNGYRNFIAVGSEKRAGRMPKAADMLEMVRNLSILSIFGGGIN